MGSIFRIGLWLLAAAAAIYGCIVGVLSIVLFAVPATDIDGPISWTNRAAFAGMSSMLIVGSLAALALAAHKVQRAWVAPVTRRHPIATQV